MSVELDCLCRLVIKPFKPVLKYVVIHTSQSPIFGEDWESIMNLGKEYIFGLKKRYCKT